VCLHSLVYSGEGAAGIRGERGKLLLLLGQRKRERRIASYLYTTIE
jgi:hypothetical protein